MIGYRLELGDGNDSLVSGAAIVYRVRARKSSPKRTDEQFPFQRYHILYIVYFYSTIDYMFKFKHIRTWIINGHKPDELWQLSPSDIILLDKQVLSIQHPQSCI